MRVLYFVERFWPHIGGLEVVSARLVTALAGRGYEMLVVTGREHDWMPERETYEGITVHRLPFPGGIHDRNLERLAAARSGMNQIVAEFRPELIHASFTGAGMWALPRQRVAPLILSLHGPWETIDFSAPEGLFSRVLARADWVTACSQHTLEVLLRTAPADVAERASVVLNGLDPTFDGKPGEPPVGPPTLLCSGRVVAEKGFDVAIDALAQLGDADVRLVIAGDGGARGDLEKQASRLGLSGRVTFTGWVSPDEIHDLVARATVVLAPSRLEGFGLTALEAAQMARPVVAADTGGLPEVVVDGVTGLVVPRDNVAAFAAAIERLLASPELGRRMGNAGRRRALMDFSAERHLAEWEALYRRVAKMPAND